MVHVAFSPTWEDRGDLFDPHSHQSIKILAGERVEMRMNNLGGGHFSNAIVAAYFEEPSPDMGDSLAELPGFGWGTYRGGLLARRGSPDAQYTGAWFRRLEAGRTSVLAPDVVQTCSPVFPYNATLLQLDINMDVLCTSGRDQGKVGFQLVARNERGATRVIRDFQFEACLDRNADASGEDRFSDPDVQLAYRYPPRGVTNFRPLATGGGYQQY